MCIMNTTSKISLTLILVILTIIAISGVMVGCPKYEVYTQRMAGEALLAHAQSSKEVAVSEAKAKMEAATLLAQAEVERAKGVAQANKIIGDSLKDNEAYLRYLFVNNLENTKNQVIYIPTESNLPILEANRNTKK